MTELAIRGPVSVSLRSAAVVGGLVLIVGARWAATAAGLADGLTVGLGFGLALTGLAFAGGQRLAAPRPVAVLTGVGGGLALVAIALVAHGPGPGSTLAPASTFAPWAAITILVATGEELLLRGVLFGALQRVAGVSAAVVATSLLFALIHVPVYGWHVVPLDFGVGIWLAGLRLLTGGPAAPAVAHAVADLTTWWL